MKAFLVKLKNQFLDMLFPNDIKCIVCDKEIPITGKFCMCDECFEVLPKIENACIICGCEIKSQGKVCLYCKNNKRNFVRNKSVFNYQPPASFLISAFKYKNARYLVGYLANFMVEIIDEHFDIITFVPLHHKKLKRRGFNQSEMLCKCISERLEIKMECLLIRTENTLAQTSLNRKLRQQNLVGCFAVNKEVNIKDKKILIVDDVFTTGSTLDECAKVLNKGKAKSVSCVTLAHTNPKSNIFY